MRRTKITTHATMDPLALRASAKSAKRPKAKLARTKKLLKSRCAMLDNIARLLPEKTSSHAKKSLLSERLVQLTQNADTWDSAIPPETIAFVPFKEPLLVELLLELLTLGTDVLQDNL